MVEKQTEKENIKDEIFERMLKLKDSYSLGEVERFAKDIIKEREGDD